MKKPFRLLMAQIICGLLPPLASQKIRDVLYPIERAYRDDYHFTRKSITGSIFYHTTNDYHAYPFSVHGYYQWRHLAIAKMLCARGGSIIEVGANVGTETIGFSDLLKDNGTVYSFEPLPANFAALQKTLDLNHIQNVILYPFAVLDEKKSVRFQAPASSNLSGSGHVIFRDAEKPDQGFIDVEGVHLDHFLESIHQVAMIFMDAEGSEPLIIQGAEKIIRRDKPGIVLEASQKQLSRSGYSITKLAAKIRSFDYEIFHIGRFKVERLVPGDQNPQTNWLCLHKSKTKQVPGLDRFLVRSGMTPCFRWIHPLVHVG